MPLETTAALVDALRQYRILEPHQLAEVQRDLQGRFPDPRALAKELLQRGWLTPFQINRLFQGKGQELILASYLLIDPLGQGGMGQVYKARHQRLDRIDAVKVIKSNLLANPNAIERFRREAKAAARLSHPNVVTVYDAGEVGTTHFLAMEFIPGIDLSKLVKEKGPLPVAQACEYIRQAACGLAHAHEKSLVHRDIKPSNLIVVSGQWTVDSKDKPASSRTTDHWPPATIKILDMGLARLNTLQSEQTVESLTDTGAVVGTADFIAPEQARNARDVDIRADIYSLGCTLYYLLCGKIPFPGETLTEKLIKHQLEEPRPLESLRPDVPPGVLVVVRKMMAKRVEDRYQTPAEVARALQPYCTTTSLAPPEPTPLAQQIKAAPLPGISPVLPPPMAMPAYSDLSLPSASTGDTASLRSRFAPRNGRSIQVMLLVPVVIFLLVGVVGAAVWWVVGRKPDAVAATNSPSTKPATTAAANGAPDPKEALRHFERGNQLSDKGQVQQAIAEFTLAIQLDANMAEAYANRGLLYRNSGALDNALADYNKAIALYQARPRDPRIDSQMAKVYFNRATLFHDRREWDRCIADNTRVIEINPKDPVAWNNRGTIYKIKREYDKAIADFDEALRLNATYMSPLSNRAGTYLQKGDFDQAIIEFEKVIRRDPDSSTGYEGRGHARMLKNQLDQALEDFNQAIRLNPKDALAYLHRSDTYKKMGNQQQANADYQQAIKLDPRLTRPGG